MSEAGPSVGRAKRPEMGSTAATQPISVWTCQSSNAPVNLGNLSVGRPRFPVSPSPSASFGKLNREQISVVPQCEITWLIDTASASQIVPYQNEDASQGRYRPTDSLAAAAAVLRVATRESIEEQEIAIAAPRVIDRTDAAAASPKTASEVSAEGVALPADP